MVMKKFILFLFFNLFIAIVIGQNKQIDSLQNIINTTKIDTIKGRTLCRLCTLLTLKKEFIEASVRGELGMEILQRVNDPEGIGDCSQSIANAHLAQDDLSKALKYYQKSLSIYPPTTDAIKKIDALKNVAHTYYSMGDQSKSLEYYRQVLDLSIKSGKPDSAIKILNSFIGSIYKNQSMLC